MRDSRPHSLEFFFTDQTPLQDIQQKAAALIKINRTVMALLSPGLAEHCRVANYRQHILILETDNASWLMRLRYEQSHLTSQLRAKILPSLVAIDIRINPSFMGNSAQKAQENRSDKRQAANNPAEVYSNQLSVKSLLNVANRSPERLRRELEKLAALIGERNNTANHEK